MYEKPIDKMDFKELREVVQHISDSLEKYKRLMADTVSNIDSDNFSKQFLLEYGNMRSKVTMTAKAISSMVTDTDLTAELEKYSTIVQTAEQIELAVVRINGTTDEKLKEYSTISQTADAIKTVVAEETAGLVSDTDLAVELKNYSTIEQTNDSIRTVVSKSANLDSAIPVLTLDEATDINEIYVIQSFDSSGNVIGEKYYYYNSVSKQWEILSGDSIYTVFNQTESGFELKGNVMIDGNTVITKNLTLSGNVTWDMDNSPVLTRYSSDNLNWHSTMAESDMYMQMSFDGGVNWTTSTKVVGTDGKNGKDGHDGDDGSDANVTPENVFDALTDNGANQGIFAAFVNKNNRIYINAEYLATKIADVADKIYIGDYDTNDQQKSIYFNDQANISTFDSMYGHNGLVINSNGLRIASNPNKIEFNIPQSTEWITLADYIVQNAGSGGGTTTVVFG